jgi:putative nucleotidyltransferase with HDIG domain
MLDFATRISQKDLQNNYLYIAAAQPKSGLLREQMELLKTKDEIYPHTQRVQFLAGELAKHKGMGMTNTMDLVRAAELHDIGKLLVPDKILEKKELSEKEMKIVEQHVVTSYEVVKPFMPKVANIIIGHHRYQEHPYPDLSLYGPFTLEEVEQQKNLSLVDKTDALLSERSYKPAWTISETRSHLISFFGNPELVDFVIGKWGTIGA